MELKQGADPNNKLDSLLAEVDPQVIGNKLIDLDRSIIETWLTLAKQEWHARARDKETGGPLTMLKDAYSAVHNGKLPKEQYGNFSASLPTAPCWVATAQSSMSIPILPELFDIVMIDEASQCTITNILPFAYRAKRLVVIGDAKQLPAISNITALQETDLARNHELTDREATQFAHVGNNDWNVYAAAANALPSGAMDVQMLLDHFRCHPAIISFSNRYIYNEALKLCKYPDDSPLPCAPGVNVVDVPGGSAERGANNRSWVNTEEAQAVRKLVLSLLAQGADKSIGVITAFKGQKKYLENILTDVIHTHKVLIDTAHGFQGDERDIIIYSPAVSPGIMGAGTIEWIEATPNLVNVAVTRARNAFFFVGNIDYCASLPGYLGKLATYCSEIQTMQNSDSPAEVELYGWMLMRKWGKEVKVHHIIPNIDQELDFFMHTNGHSVSIEVDGDQYHQDRRELDNARDAVLRGQGIVPLRFSPNQIHKMPFNVIKQIEEALGF